jgi:hypothetical protein
VNAAVMQRAVANTLLMGAACSSVHADQALTPTATGTTLSDSGSLNEITVTAQRLELLETADTASQRGGR